jgi:putative ABC transport system ATP-binding protein
MWRCQAERAVLIVTHDNRIFPLADRIIGMEDGRITHDGATAPDEAHP